jgi:hypothetical protein
MATTNHRYELEAQEIAAAAREAAAIGGHVSYDAEDPAQRPLIEAGEGVAEGFELAEQELIEAAEGTDVTLDPFEITLASGR